MTDCFGTDSKTCKRDKLETENAKLRAALKPFSDEATLIVGACASYPVPHYSLVNRAFTFAEWKAAHEAVQASSN